MRTHCLSLLALSALASFTTRDARACSPPACDPIVVAPADGASVPANLPGFPVLDETRRPLPDAGPGETALVLCGPNGQSIPLERRPLGAGSGLYVPQTPLLPGPHQLAFVSNCHLSVAGPVPLPEVVRNVNVVAAAPLPTQAGQVTTSASYVPKYSSGCSFAGASRGPAPGPVLLLGLLCLALWRGGARQIRRLLVAALLLGTACESGWDTRGVVLTQGVTNKARPLDVFLLNQRTLDRDHLPTEAADYLGLASADVIPADQLSFSHSAFGCHAGAVLLVAWAPKSAPAVGASFAPQSGDLVVVSDVRSPYCGVQTKYDDVTLVLDDSKTVP